MADQPAPFWGNLLDPKRARLQGQTVTIVLRKGKAEGSVDYPNGAVVSYDTDGPLTIKAPLALTGWTAAQVGR